MARGKKSALAKKVALLDEKYLGQEPMLSENATELNFSMAFNWYNYFYTMKDGKTWILEWMKNSGYSKNAIKKIENVHEIKFNLVYGAIARMLSRGSFVQERMKEKLKAKIEEVSNQVEETSNDTDVVVSLQDRVSQISSDLIAELDGKLDLALSGDFSFNTYNYLKTNNIRVAVIGKVSAYFKRVANDLTYEGHEYLGKKRFKEYKAFVEGMVADLDRYASNEVKTRAPRKPRAKKMKSPEEQVKNLQYKVEDLDLKIKSVNPAAIIGARQIWLYNTKYKVLMQYSTEAEGGLGVKGNKILNYDKGRGRKLRKPSETLQTLLSAGKVGLRTILDNLTTKEFTPNGKFNSDIVIVRVVR